MFSLVPSTTSDHPFMGRTGDSSRLFYFNDDSSSSKIEPYSENVTYTEIFVMHRIEHLNRQDVVIDELVIHSLEMGIYLTQVSYDERVGFLVDTDNLSLIHI